MAKPKICFVAQDIYPFLKAAANLNLIGGAELQQKLLAEELVRRGYPVSFVTMNHGQEKI